MENNRCIIILSEKSSGSSALMKYLLRYEDIHAVKHTRHNERETLFWTKAASVLELHQKGLVGSEVPISKCNSSNQLLYFLRQNNVLGLYHKSGIGLSEAWGDLCERYSPVFLEKSPHYLANWVNISLILDAIGMLPKINHQIVGLIRHPLNTLYSIHRRWKLNLNEYEKQWRRSYTNLLRLKKILPDKVHIVKYEDMCKTANHLKPVIEFAGYKEIKEASFKEPRKIPESFNFKLQESTIKLAEEFGYE
ncbi:MAG TPA: sulfotransferase [Williamwhitmania sp.]|nr:sulfotransferase [Williamwhitmania sp.]